jgi:hypothetical protein
LGFKASKFDSQSLDFWLPLIILVLGFCSLALPNLSPKFPGIRRATGVIAALYLAIVWVSYKYRLGATENKAFLIMSIGILALFSLHNSYAFIANLPEKRADYVADYWLKQGSNPVETLENLDRAITYGNQILRCERFTLRSCRYAEIFATLKANRKWNSKPDIEVKAWQPEHKVVVVLNTSLWRYYYLPH